MQQNNKTFLIALLIIFLGLLACVPGGGGSPAGGSPGGGGAPATGGGIEVGGIDTSAAGGGVEIDADQIAQAAESAVAGQDSDTGTDSQIDSEQASEIASAVLDEPANASSGTVDTGLLSEKFSSAVPDENGNLSVTVTEEETNQALQLGLSASGTNMISNAYIAYTGGTIIFTGDIEQGAVRAVIWPYIENGSLQFEILEVNLNGTQLPPAMYAAVSNTINTTLTQAMGQIPDQIELTGVSVGEGNMTLTGRITS